MLPASATGPGWRAGSADGLEGVHLGPSGVLVLEPEGVDGGVVGPLGGQRVFREDRGHGALGFAGPAVDALVGIDEQLAVGAGVEVDATCARRRRSSACSAGRARPTAPAPGSVARRRSSSSRWSGG